MTIINNTPSESNEKLKTFLFFVKKRKKIIIISFIFLIVFIYFYSKGKTKEAESIYTIGSVSKNSIFSMVSGSGSVVSLSQIDVKSDISSKIISSEIRVGQEVKEGDVLLSLDDNELRRKFIEAQNSLAIAQNNLETELNGPDEEEILSAKISLENSKKSYEDSLTNLDTVNRTAADNLKKAELELSDAQRAYETTMSSGEFSSESNNQEIISTYNNAKTTITSSYISLRSAIILADSILGMKFYGTKDISSYENLLGAKDSSALVEAKNNFYIAKDKIEIFENKYNSISNSWNNEEIENILPLLLEAANSSRLMMTSVYSTLLNSITSSDFTQSDLDSLKQSVSSQESNMLSLSNNVESTVQNIKKLEISIGSSDLSLNNNLENAKNSLKNAEDDLAQVKIDNEKNIKSAESDISIKKTSYELAVVQYNNKINEPKDSDILSYKIQVSQAESNYLEAKENLENCNIKAAINGKIAEVYFKEGEYVSDGAVIATIISNENLAEINLNEVDVAKLKLDQRANITFNAIDDLVVSGKIVEIDNLGSNNQGVVSYITKISLDVQDERIKPQMSVSADIIVDERINVISVKNSLVKSDDAGYYVEVIDSATSSGEMINSKNEPERKYVETGLSDDSNTEIISGLNEGDLIIIKTSINSDSNTNSSSGGNDSSSQKNNFNMMGGAAGMLGGGMPR